MVFAIHWQNQWFNKTMIQNPWISHGFTCVPHPEPPSHLPPHPIPLGLPIAPSLSTCLMHPTWAGCFTLDNIHVSMLFSQIIPPSPSPRVQKSVLYICVSFSVLHIGLSLPIQYTNAYIWNSERILIQTFWFASFDANSGFTLLITSVYNI